MTDPHELWTALQTYALTLPEAYEDHPWGEVVIKVNKKIFLFLGTAESESVGIGVKLVESHGHALSLPGATPSGYGLGRAGWVSLPLTADSPPLDVMEDWVAESYRLVAPKRLVGRLTVEG